MKNVLKPILLIASLTCLTGPVVAEPPAATELLSKYSQSISAPFNIATGKRMWLSQHTIKSHREPRSCSSCHGDDLTSPGKHIKTGKVIEPISFLTNAERFTDSKKIEKWFRRNCKWTWGRECTPTEKGNLLVFLLSQ